MSKSVTYQTTATGVDCKCMFVFSEELINAMIKNNKKDTFGALSYSKRKEFSRQVTEAKTQETTLKRIQKVIDSL